MNNDIKRKIPNYLTILRIVLIPVIVGLFYIPGKITSLVIALLFMLASITDYFDGYLARYYKVQSNFGVCFDPIADKLLVAVVLIMLVGSYDGAIYILMPSIIIICREILVSGLREFLANFKVSMPVTKLAKWKTAIQMIAITILLLVNKNSLYSLDILTSVLGIGNTTKLFLSELIQTTGVVLLNIASILTIITGYAYYRLFSKKI